MGFVPYDARVLAGHKAKFMFSPARLSNLQKKKLEHELNEL